MVRRAVVMVADDTLRSRLLDALSASGLPLSATGVASVGEGLQVIQRRGPDVVVCDAHPADMPAARLLRRVHELIPELPVFLVEDDAPGKTDGPEAVAEKLRAGAADHIVATPCSLAKLPFLVLAAGGRDAGSRIPTAGGRRMRDLAHDLRSPLTGLAALVQMLSSGVDGTLSPAQVSRLERIRATIDRIAALLDRLSELATVESGDLALTPRAIDLADVILLAGQDLDERAGTRAGDLRVHLPRDLPRILADPTGIRRVLSILVREAQARAGLSAVALHARHAGDKVTITLLEEPGRAVANDSSASHAPPRPAAGPGEGSRRLDLALAGALVRRHEGTLRMGGDRMGSDAAGNVLAELTLPAERKTPPPKAASRSVPLPRIGRA